MNQHIDQTILSSPHFDGCPWPGDIYKMGIGLTGSTTEIQIEIWCSSSTSLGGVRVTFPFIGVLFCVHIIIIIVVFQTCRIIKTQVTLKGGVTKKCAASRSDQFLACFHPLLWRQGQKKWIRCILNLVAADVEMLVWCWVSAALVCAIITQSMACNYLTRIKKWPLEQILRARSSPGSRGWCPVTRSQMASSSQHLSSAHTPLVTMILSDFRLRRGSVSSDQKKNLSSLSWYWKPFTPSLNSHWIASRQWDLSKDNIQDTNIQRYLSVCTNFLTLSETNLYPNVYIHWHLRLYNP